MKRAVPLSQGLAAEATKNQQCRHKDFPYCFVYNPFPLKNCWVQEIRFIANEYWRKELYLERLCTSSRVKEKGCVLVYVLWLEKLICIDVKIPAVSLGDADTCIASAFRWDGMTLYLLSV